MEDLPTDFDLVVLGTGLPESIIAAAASRLDKSVLQLDANAFYGREWAGFRLQDLREFLRNCGCARKKADGEDVKHLVEKGESLVTFGAPSESISNFVEVIYVKDDVVETDIAPQPRQERYRRRSERHASGSSTSSTGSPVGTPIEEVFPVRKAFTFEDVLALSRQFSLDLSPKLFWTTDHFVALLTSSNVARYASFRLVHSVATFINGRIVEVPFSRSAISNHPDLGGMDKRKVMKFMQLCMEYSLKEKEETEMTPPTFGAYLDHLKIPSLTRHSIINAIALCTEDTPTKEGLSRVHRFLSACGRYDKNSSPFLFSIFGCGEYPQYFARISAVFGGIQCLKRGVDGVVVDSVSAKVVAVISDSQRITSRQLLVPVEYAPPEWTGGTLRERNLSRAILITDMSVFPKRPSDVGFLRFPKENDELGVMMIEASHVTEICPSGYFVVYLWTNAVLSAREDLEPYALKLFEPYRADRVGMPKVLWAAFFNHKHVKVEEEGVKVEEEDVTKDARPRRPLNVQMVSGPSGSLDYEDVVRESKGVFDAFYPGEAFLPRVPDPEEIILDGGEPSSTVVEPTVEPSVEPTEKELGTSQTSLE